MNEEVDHHPVCRYCKSENISVDGVITWDNNKQVWTLDNVMESGYCNDCDEPIKWFDWVDNSA